MLESSLVYTITRTLPESIVVVLSGYNIARNRNRYRQGSKVIKYGICYWDLS